MIGPTPFRDIMIVATFEIREMFRTKRIVVMVALYLLGGLLAAEGFVSFLATIESAAAEALGAAATRTPGALTNALLEDPTYRGMIASFLHDDKLTDWLLSLPPMAVFFGWVSFAMVPSLIVLTSTDYVARETQRRGIRFLIVRTGRLEVVVGKLAAQVLSTAIVVLLMGLVFVGVALHGLQGASLGPLMMGILEFWPRVVVYGLAFIGLTALFATNARSTNMARALSLIALVGIYILDGVGSIVVHLGWEDVGELIHFLLPFIHGKALWTPDILELVPNALVLVGLAFFYTLGALLIFARRDL